MQSIKLRKRNKNLKQEVRLAAAKRASRDVTHKIQILKLTYKSKRFTLNEIKEFVRCLERCTRTMNAKQYISRVVFTSNSIQKKTK